MRLIESALVSRDALGLVIGGAAGVGKSRLFHHALQFAAGHGAVIRVAVGTSSARALPLGALASWAPPAGGDNLQLVRSVIDGLVSVPAGRDVIVGVDDAHLLDDLSIFVLHQIVQRRTAKVVATVRTGEVVPLALQEVWATGEFERIDLQPLSRDEAGALVAAALGGLLDPDTALRLWRLTRGNALYLRNVVEQEVSARRLTQNHDVWMWTGHPVLPPGLIELIETRIGALPAEVAEVIDVLALGEPIELSILRRITEPSAIEEAEVRGLITLEEIDGGVHARVAHPLYGEVRRRTAAATRLRRLRGRIAAELAVADTGDGADIGMLVRRASLMTDSDLAPDAGLLIRAAQGAVWMADLPLADQLAAAAVRADGGPEAGFIHAHALSWLSQGEQADAVLTSISTTEFDGAAHARLAFLRGINKLFACADPVGAKAVIDAAGRVIAEPAGGAIEAFLAVHAAAMGHPPESRELSKSLALEDLPDLVAAVTAWGITIAAGDAGLLAEVIAATEAGYARTARTFDAAQMRFVIADAHVGALLLAGHVAQATSVAERLRRQAADLPGVAQLVSTAIAGRAALGAGSVDVARALLEPAVEMLVASGDANGWAYRYQLPLTVAVSMCGSRRDAEVALVTLEQIRHPGYPYLHYEHEVARAWVTARQGVTSEAARICTEAAIEARERGQLAAEVFCLQTAVQFGDRCVGERLAELAGVVEGPRVAVALRMANALRAADGDGLSSASSEFESVGDLVAAADAAGEAAAAYRRQNRKGSAYSAAARSEKLVKLCGDIVTPASADPGERLPLSVREREIVALLADGLTSRSVADRLSLSVRTVEGHIYRAMAKTGAGSREALAGILFGGQ
jgi:DNA-binding CsgD family transcriptional regulator